MSQLFPVPDDATLERMRRALDVLELMRQIERHVPPDHRDTLTEVKQAVCGEHYTRAVALLTSLISSLGRPHTEMVVALLHLMLAAEMPDAAERMARLFQSSSAFPAAHVCDS